MQIIFSAAVHIADCVLDQNFQGLAIKIYEKLGT